QIIGLLRSNLKRFAVTIKDLTTFIETDNFTHDHESEEIDIHEVAGNVKQDLGNLITDTNARLEIVSDENLAFSFPKKNFKSMLYNLVSNAIKYRSPDRTPEVLVKLHKTGGKIVLSVSDNGLGIPAESQNKLFTMFKRFHDHVEGSGLGLYIVKRMVDSCKGQIKVHSEVNKGTTFTIVF
ncbi:MAG: HAMP domain-containing histidine kinase, partial [Sphingobacteriales bacterium]